jgi:hypothetical protein
LLAHQPVVASNQINLNDHHDYFPKIASLDSTALQVSVCALKTQPKPQAFVTIKQL